MTINHYYFIVPLAPSCWGKWDSMIHTMKRDLKVRNEDLCLHKHCLYIKILLIIISDMSFKELVKNLSLQTMF